MSIDKIPQDMAKGYVDSLYDSTCQAIHDCVENNVLRTESHPRTKRCWTAECKATRDRNRLSYYIWKCCGRQASCTSVIEMLVRTIDYAVDVLFTTNHRIL